MCELQPDAGLMLGTGKCIAPLASVRQPLGEICQHDVEGEILLAPLSNVQNDVTQSCGRTLCRDFAGAAGTKCYRLHAAQHTRTAVTPRMFMASECRTKCQGALRVVKNSG